jgi:hypothetical protein
MGGRGYRVVLIPGRGQSAGFLVNDVLPWIERGSRRVLGLFDFDKAGEDIEQNARRRLERHTGVELDWTRLVLTSEQIAEHGMPLIRRRDGRDGQVRLVAETEAMPQAVLMGLVEDALRALLPTPLDRVHGRERRKRCGGAPPARHRCAHDCRPGRHPSVVSPTPAGRGRWTCGSRENREGSCHLTRDM